MAGINAVRQAAQDLSFQRKFAEAHPDWQVQFEFFTTDIGGGHARLLEQARAGRAPDCVSVDSFQLALFDRKTGARLTRPAA